MSLTAARSSSVAGLSAVIALAVPSGAAARTIVVDDDRAQCPAALHTEIQPAVDEARSGDVVSVCAGAYAEQVHLDDSARRNVTLIARPRRGVRLEPPPSFDSSRPAAVLTLGERGAVARGFVLGGTLPSPPEEACGFGSQAHVLMSSPLTWLLDTRIEDATGPGCPGQFVGYAGVVVQEFGATSVTRGATIDGGELVRVRPIAIGVVAGAANILRSTLAASGKTGAGVTFDELSTGIVRVSTITGFRDGLRIQNAFGPEGLGPVRAIGNTIAENAVGVRSSADNGAGMRIESNTLRRNDTGISLGMNDFLGLEPGGFVLRNLVTDSTANGIETAAAFFRVEDNTVLRSGGFDCFNAGPSRWSRNKGVRSSPPGLCRP